MFLVNKNKQKIFLKGGKVNITFYDCGFGGKKYTDI